MIKLITEEDFNKLWNEFVKVKERTLRQTKQIQELQREVKRIKGVCLK